MTPEQAAANVAAEVRAEMARQHKTQSEMAQILGTTSHTVSRRLTGDTPFDIAQLITTAEWLDVDVENFLAPQPRTTRQQVAS